MNEPRRENGPEKGHPLAIGAEMVSYIFGGAAIGYGLDRLLSTKPLMIITLLVLGFVLAMVRVKRFL